MQSDNKEIHLNNIEEEAKPQYVRLRVSTRDLFSKLSEQENKSQDEFLGKLIELYNLEKAKEVIPGKADIIEELQEHLKRITSIVVNLVEHNINIEGFVSQRFKEGLREKEERISSLESKVTKLEEHRKENNALINELKKKLEKEVEDHFKVRQLNYKNEELLEKYKTQLDQITTSLSEFEAKEKEVNKHLGDLGMNVIELISEFKLLNERTVVLESENNAKASMLESVNEEKTQLTLKIKELRLEIEGLKEQVDFYKSGLYDREEIIKELREANKQELKDIRKEYKEEVQDLAVKYREETIELNEKHRNEIVLLKEKLTMYQSKEEK